jgi:type IV pilus assembly protein PilQ
MDFKIKNRSFLLTILLVFVTSFRVFGQHFSEDQLRLKLDSLSLKSPGLNKKVETSVSGLPLYEFVHSLGYENNLNITIEPTLNKPVSYNLSDAIVKDVLVFLYLNFELEYEFVGNIISVKSRNLQIGKVTPKQIDITYNNANEFLSMNLSDDILSDVVEKITRLTDKNFVIAPEVRNNLVNAFFQNRPYEQVLEMFVNANNLTLVKEKENYYTIKGLNKQEENLSKNSERNTSKATLNTTDFTLEKNSLGNLDIFANNIDLIEIIKAAALEFNSHYVLHSTIEGKANLELQNVTFDELLKNLFQTTRYNYSFNDDIYVIGELKMQGIRKTELIRLENRSVENVKTAIPKDLLLDIEISDFLDLNGLIVTGSEKGISELKIFLKSIDVVVPMIQIDVIFMYSSIGNKKDTGLKIGLKDNPTTTTGGIDETGINGSLGANAINNLLNAINGFGILNLGLVTENFYVSLKALEENKIISTESTPKISTLNGQKGTISIGETKFYQQQQINVISSIQQSGIQTTKNWTPIEANLSVSIVPFVSADEQITISIAVTNSEFGPQTDPTAPPGKTDQSFESTVRVKNGEVILLGGLEKKSKSNSGKGVPFLAKIPVIKWFFSNQINEKSKSKLHILIKPTVIY